MTTEVITAITRRTIAITAGVRNGGDAPVRGGQPGQDHHQHHGGDPECVLDHPGRQRRHAGLAQQGLPHQGMVSAKKAAVPAAMAIRRGERPSARIAPMATTTTTK